MNQKKSLLDWNISAVFFRNLGLFLVCIYSVAASYGFFFRQLNNRQGYGWVDDFLAVQDKKSMGSLREFLQGNPVVGFVSEEELIGMDSHGFDSQREYVLMQYALAPVVVDRAKRDGYVVGWFWRGWSTLGEMKPGKFVLVKDFGDGFVVLTVSNGGT